MTNGPLAESPPSSLNNPASSDGRTMAMTFAVRRNRTRNGNNAKANGHGRRRSTSLEVEFRKEELDMLDTLTSLNFARFNASVKAHTKEKFLLFKASRYYEQELLELLEAKRREEKEDPPTSTVNNTISVPSSTTIYGNPATTETTTTAPNICHQLQSVYLKLGHVNLLAQDYARALSAYQKAHNNDKKEFWRNASGLYGLGLCYYHFRAYQPAIEAFCRLLFSHPYCQVASEVHARLGIAFKCLETPNFPQALKHLLIALDDPSELILFPKHQLRFHVAHCYDGAGDFRRAVEEYKRLLHSGGSGGKVDQLIANASEKSQNSAGKQLPKQLLATVYRQLGWISFRQREEQRGRGGEAKEEYRAQKLKEAEQYLLRARELLQPTSDSKTNCYLGLVYSEQTHPTSALPAAGSNPQARTPLIATPSAADRAQEAFVSYRSAIDADESDASTWCSIGVLYQQQNQPLDALQAFACAVQLDPKNSAVWIDLGRLYESNQQYKEALGCYKKAVEFNPAAPESLKERVTLLEKELRRLDHYASLLTSTAAATASGGRGKQAGKAGSGTATATAHQQQTASQQLSSQPSAQLLPPKHPLLPPLESAWQLGIPAQVRQRLADFNRQQQQLYRDGSPLWKMSDLLAAHSLRLPYDELDPTRRQLLHILNRNKGQLEQSDLAMLRDLEQHYAALVASHSSNAAVAVGSGLEMESVEDGALEEVKMNATGAENLDGGKDGVGGENGEKPTTSATPTTIQLDFGTSTHLRPAGGKPPLALISKSSTSNNKGGSCDSTLNFPPPLSLLAPVRVPVTISSSELLELCRRRLSQPEDYQPIFDEATPPPQPPQPPPPLQKSSVHSPSAGGKSAVSALRERLLLKTPLIVVENQKEAHLAELQNFCYASPIALVHGLTAALKIDLSQFSTKTLIETAPEHEVEVRTQYKMPGDANLDHMGRQTWACYSAKSFTNIARYGTYQAESFRHSLKEETDKLRQGNTVTSTTPTAHKTTPTTTCTVAPLSSTTPELASTPTPKRRRTAAATNQYPDTPPSAKSLQHSPLSPSVVPLKVVKFGTNVDLSDERKFHAQLRELNKMPSFCRLSAACNLLTHLGHTVLGMNTVQLYMKVPGCRTPGHLENNSFASININIGPGECEWFAVPYEYWPVLERLCKERNLDFLKGAWWPNFTDLLDAEVPVYRFTQKAGDLVWVGGGCVHWVQSTGWCNNIAWNVGPVTAQQLEMALYAHEWNRLNTYRSLVPMQHLCWQLAREVRFSNQRIYNIVKQMLIRSLAYCRMVADYVQSNTKSAIKLQPRLKGETAHYCHLCDIEVFNLLFVKEIGGKFRVFCVQCSSKNLLDDYVVLQQISFDELCQIFDRFQLHPSKTALIC